MIMDSRIAIVTDSIACVPQEKIAQYGIEVVPIQLIFGDKVYRDGVDITATEFYAKLKEAEKLPTTAGAIPGVYLEAFRRASQKAANIICITVSAKLSGSYDSARQAKEVINKEQPEINVELIDSQNAAAAEGLVVMAAAREAAEGKNLEQVVAAVRQAITRAYLFVSLDTLYYLVKGGHVPKVAAMASSLLKIKPILTISDGEAVPVTSPRTTNGAIKRLLNLMERKVANGKPLYVTVTHAAVPDKAVTLRDLIASRFDCTEIYITEFTPVMGAHCGPGVLGLAFCNGGE